jgi:hypothetical protein
VANAKLWDSKLQLREAMRTPRLRNGIYTTKTIYLQHILIKAKGYPPDTELVSPFAERLVSFLTLSSHRSISLFPLHFSPTTVFHALFWAWASPHTGVNQASIVDYEQFL